VDKPTYYRVGRRAPHWFRKFNRDFHAFLLRGNILNLAVAFTVGAAASKVVAALVADLITPLLAAIYAQPDFSELVFTVNGSKFHIGHFINALIAFALVALIVFFFVVKPFNALDSRLATKQTRRCPQCCSDIPVEAVRCAFCTSPVHPPSATVAMTTVPPPPSPS
jgi:large conductance mechanosensitive channel